MKTLITFVFSFVGFTFLAQSPWPSSNWDISTNLTPIMSASGVEGLSGVHYNPTKNQLFLVQDIGRMRIIQLNAQGNHLQLTDRNLGCDLEGIMQINDSDNEFWVLCENEYIIKRYQYNANFSSVTVVRSWDLLLPQSGMEETIEGPEGICFVPDSYLDSANFISSVSGQPYTSQKGMGGLVFVAHQNLGQIWVFDINKNLNNDYVLVGVYNTNRMESCGLSFDKSTGLLYILHNIDNNYLEVCDLSVSFVNDEYKLNMVQEFNVTLPTNGGKNIEGVAVSPKCDMPDEQTVWLVRDVTGPQSVNSLKEFRPFGLVGSCVIAGISEENNIYSLAPNPVENVLYCQNAAEQTNAVIYNLQGKEVGFFLLESGQNQFDLSHLDAGIYFFTSGSFTQKIVVVK
jgi:hypothetical protein